ncbi:MAG TPA: SDR family oxidoreductase [Xanthobacteraceae bacterium]|nr:SDR family oxidoreductase [Xanthobacteraceae bacterium]
MSLRILLTGATGLIGSAVLARLRSEGHEVIAVVRAPDGAARRLPASGLVVMDIARAARAEDWLPHLAGIDAVVNCAGVLQDSPTDSTAGVHTTGIAALFAACEQAGVRRVIHFSAVGVDRAAPTAFSRTKRLGDQALMGQDLDWVILRPSVVVGRAAYGGSALFRGLATLPILPVVPDTGPLMIVWLDDVVATVSFFLHADAPARLVLELVGPQALTFTQVVRAFRRWLGYPPAREVPLPRGLAALFFYAGDLVGLLGWRPPMRSTARREIARGASGDASEWRRITGLVPRPLAAALAAEPASVQERWFAPLYVLKPVVFATLSLYCIATGAIALGPGFAAGEALMREAGLGSIAAPGVVAGALIDIAIGMAIAVRRTARIGLQAGLALSLFYVIAVSALLPRLWVDPLGPLVKIAPIIVLIVVALAVRDDR